MTAEAKPKVSIVGLGYVGLPLALLASRKGYDVTGIDLSTDKVQKINQRISPFKEDSILEDLKVTTMVATSDFSSVRESDIIIICVPTPVDEMRMPDYGPVEGACRNIAPYMKKGQLIVLESTVNPGVCEEIVMPLLEKETGMQCGTDFYLAHCPERIDPGNPKWTVDNINRVVGSNDEVGLEKAYNFYSSIISGTVKKMGSLKEAEAVKIVENCFRDVNIAFVNELAMSFEKLGIDVKNVLEGAATKPFGFMMFAPSRGVGGHCIAVDPYYLIEYAKKNGFTHEFLKLARQINSHMPEYTAELVMKGLNEKGIPLNGTKVAVLGLSYKANIDDTRESPSTEIIHALKENGAEVVVFDPYLLKESTSENIDEVVAGAKAVVVATGHDQFKELTPDYFISHGVEVVVDGMNALDKVAYKSSSLVFKGIGR